VPLPERSLRTERLLMTRPTYADVPAEFAITGDARVVAHNPSDRLGSLREDALIVARWTAHWEQFGFGYWCIREADGSGVIGLCGLKVMALHGEEGLNLLYRLAHEVWGRGMASEAASAVVAWADEHQPTRRLFARIRPLNIASQRVAERIGLHRAPELDDEGEDGPDLLFVR
jgi:[ribosomal protein S5]-alanine N-acetyltransferase